MSRVLLVGKGPPDRGGIPVFLATLLHSPLVAQHEVTFLNVAHHETPQGGQLTVANLRRTAHDTLRVWRAARRHDIVHLHSALAPGVTVLRAALMAAAGRAAGARVVVHAHGGNIETWLSSRPRQGLLRWGLAPVDLVVAVWSTGHQVLSGVLGADKVRLIDNGVRVADFPPTTRPARVPRILYVGLLTPRKGVLDLIEASSLLRNRGVAHELLLVGGTPDEGPDAEVPVRAAAEGAATLLGTRDPNEMPATYAEADVFCLPSWWEAMPLSILEAMASGLPVVATDVGDVSRAVVQGETGFVVGRHSPRQLADALEPLLQDRSVRERMGWAGRARVETMFSSDVTAKAIGEVFADLRTRRPRRLMRSRRP